MSSAFNEQFDFKRSAVACWGHICWNHNLKKRGLARVRQELGCRTGAAAEPDQTPKSTPKPSMEGLEESAADAEAVDSENGSALEIEELDERSDNGNASVKEAAHMKKPSASLLLPASDRVANRVQWIPISHSLPTS